MRRIPASATGVELDGKPLFANSALGVAFADGITLQPTAKIAAPQTAPRNFT
jgi:hypothetical protein